MNDFIVANFVPTWVWQRWAGWFWDGLTVRCMFGFHECTKIQIPVTDPETGAQPMFIMRHCDRPECDKVVDIFPNWRLPWEGKHREIVR